MMIDILLEDFDLKIVDGDFVLGDATSQHQEHILLARKGNYKQYPEVGCDLANWLLDDQSPEDLAREIRAQFIADGQTVRSISVTDKISIDASY